MNKFRSEWERISKSTLAHNTAWLFAGQGASMLCQAGYFILIARLLGKTEFGIYAGAAAIVSLVSQYSSLGSHSVFLRYVSPEPSNFAPYWGNVVATTFSLGALFVALLTWIGPHLAHSYSWHLFFFVAIADCLCAQVTLAAARVFQAFERMRITAGLSLMTSLLRVVLAGAMLWMLHRGTAVEWSIAALFISAAATCLALYLVYSLYGRPKFSLILLKKRLGEGCVFALSYSTTGVYNDVDKAMLAHFGMNAANGIYTMAYRVIDSATGPIVSVQSAAIPRMFRKGQSGLRSTAAYATSILKRTAPLALICGVIVFLSAPLSRILLGPSFAETVPALRLLCWLPLFRSFQLSAGDALTGAGFQNLRFGSQAVAAALNFSINLYLIPHFSWRGAGWASLATDGLLAVSNWILLIWLLNKSASGPTAKHELVSQMEVG